MGPIEVDGQEEADLVNKLGANTIDVTAPVVKIWHAHDMNIPEQFTGTKYGFPIFELDTFSELEKKELSKVLVINCTKWAEQICLLNKVTNVAGIVNLGVDRTIFNTRPLPQIGSFTVLNIGKAEIRKGHDIIPRIFSTAFSKNDNVKLKIAFDNPFYTKDEMDSWKQYYYKKLHGYNIELVPRLESQKDIANLIESSHVGLYPARAEGWNLDALETLSMGRKVVATYCTGHKEFLNHSTGMVVEPSELELAIDGKWFFGQGNWAKIDDFCINKMAKQLNYLYRQYSTKYLDYELNDAGIEMAKKMSWENSAKQLLEIVNA